MLCMYARPPLTGARLMFGGKPLGGGHTIPRVYGAIEPTAVFVPLRCVAVLHWRRLPAALSDAFQLPAIAARAPCNNLHLHADGRLALPHLAPPCPALPRSEMLKEGNFEAVTTEVFGPFQVRKRVTLRPGNDPPLSSVCCVWLDGSASAYSWLTSLRPAWSAPLMAAASLHRCCI